MVNDWYRKGLVVGIIILIINVSVVTSTGKIDREICRTTHFDGSLIGYVNDTSGNPIEGALVRVFFHGAYKKEYSDDDGYYHVTNIPICWCIKNAICSKRGYKTEWVSLDIVENTVHDFILTPDEKMLEYDIESIDNHEIEPLDNYEEIITRINGVCYTVVIHSKRGLIRNVTFYGGGSSLEIFGWKYPFPSYFHERVTNLHTSCFIGIIYESPWGGEYSPMGIALGNIEWI